MKKYLLTGLLSFLCATAAMATTYTTENGFCDWDAEGNISSSGVSQGDYYGFSFTLNGDSLNANKPSGTTGSLTTPSDGEADFTTGSTVSLTEISIISSNSAGAFNTAVKLMLVDSKGNEFFSSSMSQEDNVVARDPWFDAATDPDASRFSSCVGTYNFDGVELTIGETYEAFYLDAAGNATSVRMRVGLNGDDGYGVVDEDGNPVAPGYSAAGLTIVTESVPEPTTATLSLLALAGLMARRRR